MIGYSVSDMSHEWYQNIVAGAQSRSDELGITLKVVDSANDVGKQISQIENMMVDGLDALIVTPIDVNGLGPVVAEAKSYEVPIIAEANFFEGAECFVGISDFAGGVQAGEWFVEYATENNIEPKILMIDLPAFENCRNRAEGFLSVLEASSLNYEVVQSVDGQGSKETALKVAQDALTAHPDVNVIFGINDNSTTGGMAAYKEAGLDESQLTAIGFGFEGVVGRDALLADGSFKAAVAMFPDYVGVSLVDAAVMAVNGETLPDHYASGTVVITQENFADFYTDNSDGTYTTNFEAIRGLGE